MFQSVVELRPVHSADVEYVAANMRDADQIEVYEYLNIDGFTAVQYSLACSERSATICVNGIPAAICGVSRRSLLSDVGIPWMLGTDVVSANARALLIYTLPVLQKMMRGYSVLQNVVHDENKASIRWLKRMGFTMGEPLPVGWRGGLFRIFELTREELKNV